MSMTYSVVPASVRHIKFISEHLRPEAAQTSKWFGLQPRVGLRLDLIRSLYCRTAIKDGVPVAIWGAKGVTLSERAVVWLALTDLAVRFPVSIMRQARKELAELSGSGLHLSAEIDPTDKKAVQFARALGFTPSDTERDGLIEMELP